MLQLETAEELVLHAFHEMHRDRVGAAAGSRLGIDYLSTLRQRDPSLDIDRGVERLVELGLIEREGSELVLTEEGERRLYPSRSGQGGVRSAS